ncbi:hypothetical protein ACXYMO_18055 [Arenibacterium sp. CAU 1754]
MTAPTQSTRTRVILGATCFADAQSALSLAVELAKQMNAELHGLLVQDEAIADAMTNPQALAISFSGARSVSLNPASMLAAFRADARQFEAQLLRCAKAAALGSAFRATEGRLTHVVEQTAAAGDLIVFGYRRTIRDGGDLVLILGDDGIVKSPARIGAALSRRLGKSLSVFVREGHEAEARNRLAEYGLSAPQIIGYTGTGALLSALDRMAPAAVIAAMDQPDLPPVARLVDVARCPVILTRSAASGGDDS